jgi:glycosyltransferase involved in cell wall biosynthesis
MSTINVSIGLPVYNGENYISKAIESVLNQTYENLELIITDNQSTDQTEKICREYAKKDKRVRYYRNKNNYGARYNYNKVFLLSKGKYFSWISHDDLIANNFIEKCISVLEKDKSVILCHSRTAKINESGEMIGNYDERGNKIRISSKKTYVRFGDLIKEENPCWWIFGLMRRNVLEKTVLFGNFENSDRNLLAELSLQGRFFEIPEYLFFRRDHPEAYTSKYVDGKINLEEQMKWWSSHYSSNRRYLGHIKNMIEYFVSIKRAPINYYVKIPCVLQIFNWLIQEGWYFIKEDIKIIFFSRSLQLASSNL